MSKTVDISMLELLSSKICHDLISPIGAVNNGLELLTDMGPSAGPEATELIAYSAAQASAKLQAFRMAYGAGGSDSSIKPEDVHKAIEQVVSADKKITQSWDPHADFGAPKNKRGFCKILACTLLLAMEALPKGGTLAVYGDGAKTVVKATGVNAGFRGHAAEALGLSLAQDRLEPQDVHARMTGLMATHYDFTVAVGQSGDDFLELTIT